jgi:hypothetical protein
VCGNSPTTTNDASLVSKKYRISLSLFLTPVMWCNILLLESKFGRMNEDEKENEPNWLWFKLCPLLAALHSVDPLSMCGDHIYLSQPFCGGHDAARSDARRHSGDPIRVLALCFPSSSLCAHSSLIIHHSKFITYPLPLSQFFAV